MLLGQRAVRAVHPEQRGKNTRQPAPARPTASVPPALLNLRVAAALLLLTFGPPAGTVCNGQLSARSLRTSRLLTPPAAGTALLSSLLTTRSLLCVCLLNPGSQIGNLLNATPVRLSRCLTSRIFWNFLFTPAFLTHVFFRGVSVPAVYFLFKLESVHFKLSAHGLVVLFYALNYLCSIFDSSAEKKKNPSRKLPTATHSKLSRQNGGKGISPVEILASPSFHSGRDCCRASGARAPAGGRDHPAFCPAGGALWALRASSPSSCPAPMLCPQAERLLWWVSPPFCGFLTILPSCFPTRQMA